MKRSFRVALRALAVAAPPNGLLPPVILGGISDGNPNPYQTWITGGFSGKMLIPSRRGSN